MWTHTYIEWRIVKDIVFFSFKNVKLKLDREIIILSILINFINLKHVIK